MHAETASKRRHVQKGTCPIHMEMEQADRHFDHSVPSNFACRMGAYACRSTDSTDLSGRGTRVPSAVTVEGSKRLSDGSVSVSTLLQTGDIPVSHKGDVFLTKNNVLYIRDLT